MDHATDDLGARIDQLAGELSRVDARLASLEAKLPVSAARHSEQAGSEPDHEDGFRFGLSRIGPESLAFTGRTLIIIGGAFLLRALTEAGLIPASYGPVIALLYATWWMLHAERSARADRRRSAAFHGFSAVVIAYPLIFEATSQLHFLSPLVGAVAVVAFLLLGLGVARRNALPGVAWASTLAAVVTVVALRVSTHELVIFVTALLGVAVAVETVAFTGRWLQLRWLVAVPLDLLVLELTQIALAPEGAPERLAPNSSEAVIVVALALPLVYLGGIGVRTLQRRQQITAFEVVQAGLALAVGLSGALRVISATGAGQAPVAVATLSLGVACYAIAFAFVERDVELARNFYTYNAYALILVLVGTWLLLGGTALAVALSVQAIIAIALGGRFARQTVKFHGVAYLVAAALQASLFLYAFEGLLAAPGSGTVPLSTAVMAVTAAAACCYAILLATAVPSGVPQRDRWPEGLVIALLVWSAAGIAGGLAASGLSELLEPEISRAFVAVARTGLLAFLAVILVWAGRRWSLLESTWLVYPIMTIGAGKLLWEDFRYGQPLTIFMALALYGGALFLIPRLIRLGLVSQGESH